MTTPSAAGWYDDPDNANAQRYWDGHSWTPQRRRKSTSPPPAPTPPARPEAVMPERAEEIHESAPAGYEPRPESVPRAPGQKRPTTALVAGAIVIVAVAIAVAIGIHAFTERHPTASPVSPPSTITTIAPKTVTVTAAPPPAPEPTTTIAPPPPPIWIAIAVSDGDGWGWATSSVSGDDAKAKAIVKCSDEGNHNCQWAAVTPAGCVALAKGSDGVVSGGRGSTNTNAEQDAVNESHGGRVLTSVCI
jgi:hypothetical protein